MAISKPLATSRARSFVSSSELVQAIKAANVERVNQIIKNASSQAERETLLAQGLSEACEHGQAVVVKHLMGLGADPIRMFGKRPPPLLIAVRSDNKTIVEQLLRRDHETQPVNTSKLLDSDWLKRNAAIRKELLRTVLRMAKSRDVAGLLVNDGADIYAQDKEGKTLLMEIHCLSVIELLIDKKVPIEARDERGRTALMTTIIFDENPAKAKLLIESGKADIEARDNEGRAILMTAVWMSRLEIVQLLIARGVNVNAVDLRGRNALHHMASDTKRIYEHFVGPWTETEQLQHDVDRLMLEALLKARIKPNAGDNHARTCLHSAVTRGSSGLLKLLLQTGRFSIDAVERRSKTPLHLAAALRNSQCLELLLEYGAEVNAEADGEWTPLHNLCGNNNDPVDSVTMLLNCGAKLQKKTRNGRTPLHIAAATGNVAIVRSLLKRQDIKRNVRDAFGNTPLLSGAGSTNKNRDEIVKLFAPSNNLHTLSNEAIKAAKLFDATIVDFGQNYEKTGASLRTPTSIFHLLYGRDFNDPSKPAMAASYAGPDPEGFRWIHLPANNVSWCQDLLTKHFIETEAAHFSSFKALEQSFNHQHQGREPQSRFMTPICQTVLRSQGTADGELTGDNETDGGPSRKSTFNEKVDPPGPGPESPKKAQFSFPRDAMQSKKRRPSEPGRDSNQTKDVRRSAAIPLPRDEETTQDSWISDFYVFMPYLHFETYKERQEMFDTYNELGFAWSHRHGGRQRIPYVDEGIEKHSLEPRRTPSPEREKTLFRAHLNTSDDSLHIRRTLDQSFYHHINTKDRDRDQVIQKFQKEILRCDEFNLDSKVLMVDQLWMWVVGKKLVITSFPQRWRQPKKDPLNVLQSVLATINSGDRERVRSVYELAMIISGRCYGAYDRHGLGSDEPQFLDMFEGWISAAMDDEVKLFRRFKEDSKNASIWLRDPHSLRNIKRRQRRKLPLEEEPSPEFKVIKGPSGSAYTSASGFVENLLDIGAETELLEEVKDIRDELDMLSLVFERQEQVLPSVREAIETIGKDSQWSPAAIHNCRKEFQDHEKSIWLPQKDIQRMEKQTDRMYNSIRDLLDLKQKHANAIEARYAREQTDDTSRQGKTLMVFTIVTVIFLPLSFIAACFAIDIKELPHKNDTQVLPLAYVSKYIFGIGLSIAVICVILALSIEDIPYYVHELSEHWKSVCSGDKKEGHPKKHTRNRSLTRSQISAAEAKARWLSDNGGAHQVSRQRHGRPVDLESQSP